MAAINAPHRLALLPLPGIFFLLVMVGGGADDNDRPFLPFINGVICVIAYSVFFLQGVQLTAKLINY